MHPSDEDLEVTIQAKVGDLVWCPYVSCIAKMRFGIAGQFDVNCPKCKKIYRVEVMGDFPNSEDES